MCRSRALKLFLDLGHQPLADDFRRADQLSEPVIHFPLRVLMCEDCGLGQLSHVVDPHLMYQHDYPYEASVTRTGREHWHEFAATACRDLGLGAEDLVVDIGSNVGVLLECFRACGQRVLGVDPAERVAALAQAKGIETVVDFFSRAVATGIRGERGRAAVVTGTNVFAHVDDLDELMLAVLDLLRPDGTFIIEAPYFVNLVERLEYDTIYHEHLSYLSVRPLLAFVDRFGMEIYRVEERDIHGGSFRVFMARKGVRPVEPVIEELVARERALRIHEPDMLAAFAAAVARNRLELRSLIHDLTRDGKRIAAVSAPAKGSTLLNYCRFGPETIEFVTEKSELKIGRYTPGTHIPVVRDQELLEQRPDYALLLAWNFADEIMDNLKDYVADGGRFILPIPKPTIVADRRPAQRIGSL